MRENEEKTVVQEVLDNRRAVENITKEGEGDYDYLTVKVVLAIFGVGVVVSEVYSLITTGAFL